MEQTVLDPATVVGVSVKGPDHEEEGTPCQDAWHGRQIGDDRFVVAVGDGLGSATHSHLGSECATETVTELLADRIEGVDAIDAASTEAAFEEAFVETRTAVEELAAERDSSASEFATTLLVVVAGPTGLAGAAVGDGGLVYRRGDSYDVIVPHESTVVDLKTDHRTYPITTSRWRESYRFSCTDAFDTFAVFSDGLSQHAWEHYDAPNPQFFDKADDVLRGASAPDDAAEQFRADLNNENFTRFGDDKTLVMGLVNDQQGDSLTDGATTSDDDEVKSDEGEDISKDKVVTVDNEAITADDAIVAVDADVVAVEETSTDVSLELSVPNQGTQRTTVPKPPAWRTTNCTLRTIVGRYDVDSTSIEDLVGKSLPCLVDTKATPVEVSVDAQSMSANRTNLVEVPTEHPENGL